MDKIWLTYKYIYYWLYTWQKKLWGESDVPEFNAVVGMSLSFVCVLLSLAVIIDLITGVQLVPLGLPKKDVILPLIGVLAGHYFMFMFKGKYKEIEKEFKKESKEDRKRKGKWVLMYAFGSLAFYVFLLFFGIWIKS